jgi:putative membrane protein insertion efficiency factor
VTGAQANRLSLLQRGAVVLIHGYRVALSPLVGPSCRYVPSCSAYAEEAITRWGLVRGMLLGLWRILRCHPFSRGGLDPVPTAGDR